MTTDERLSALEAYIHNSDPGKALTGVPGPGHNGWMMTCAALVLFMTLPGLALFYGGLVRKKNVLSVLAQCLGITGLVTILWWAIGYSLVFGKNFGSGFLGGTEFAFFRGVTSAPNTDYAFWVSQNVFAMYQLMFAIITPALIVGAVAERIKFTSVLLFVTAWMFFVYFPLAHMVWGADGLLNGAGNPAARVSALDFAGGTVVHMSSGWSALILCMIVGPRIGFKREMMPPHSTVLCMVGTGMLWVGWYGFNAGSELRVDAVTALAFLNTDVAASFAAIVWLIVAWVFERKPKFVGLLTGSIAGLAAVTPAAGYVSTPCAAAIGIAASLVCYFAVNMKNRLGWDDALDVWGVHGVGGVLGVICLGIFANKTMNDSGANGLLLGGSSFFMKECVAVVGAAAYAFLFTYIMLWIINKITPVKVTVEEEELGLDEALHGEKAYV